MPYASFELAAPIAAVFDEWVNTEHLTSMTDRNAYLDDFNAARQQFTMPLDDPRNFLAQKRISHHQRQILWGEALKTNPRDDRLVAQHIFNALMQLSGGTKRILHFASENADEYMAKKSQGQGTHTDTKKYVRGSIVSWRDAPTPEEAHVFSLHAFEETERALEVLHDRSPEDFGCDSSPGVKAIVGTQGLWIMAATAGVLMAMPYRDHNLAKVPLLEPKSISDDPEVYYPFAS